MSHRFVRTFVGLMTLFVAGNCFGQAVEKKAEDPFEIRGVQKGRGPFEIASDKPPLQSIGRLASEGPEFPDQPPVSAEDIANLRARIDLLIQQLGERQFNVRERATRELQGLNVLARSALQVATLHKNIEIANRATRLLTSIPPFSHSITDAVEKPIPYAKVLLTLTASKPDGTPDPEMESRVLGTWSDEFGSIAVPEVEETVRCKARIEHPDYGLGQCDLELRFGQRVVYLPLVHRNSEYASRALSGVVTSNNGEPVADAVVACNSVRTPGQGLIEGIHPHGDALTDAEGRFRFYLPNRNAKRERGDIIPLNSRYGLAIERGDDDSYVPISVNPSNVQLASITMPRATRVHRFRFELADGAWLESPEQIRNLFVTSRGEGLDRSVGYKSEQLIRGRKLLAGTYTATYYANGAPIQFEPLTITDDSPEELVFRLPKAKTFYGRVVHGVTRQPISGAIVFGTVATARQNLAMLTDEEWGLLSETPSNPAREHPALKLLQKHYGIAGFVRSGADGKFELVQQASQKIYNLVAVDPRSVPFRARVLSMKPDDLQRVDTGEFPLYPAAKVVVQPVFDGPRLAVAPHWLPEREGQPEWFARFPNPEPWEERGFEYAHWLTLNEAQPIYVPAGIRLRLRFDAPYDDAWAPAQTATAQQFDPGAILNLGDVKFAASLPAKVLVVDPSGKPVEGFAIRRKYSQENGWCVAHNTDKNGEAFFHVHPDSQGQFRVTDLGDAVRDDKAKNLGVDFRVGKTAPETPFKIVVTDEQVAMLRKAE